MSQAKKVESNVQVDGTVVHSDPLAEARAHNAAFLKTLSEIEAKNFAGAPDRTPKEVALARGAAVQEVMPDKRVRWINVADPAVREHRKQQGYTVLEEAQGGRTLGSELALAVLPREKYEAQVRRNEAMHRARIEDGGKQLLFAELESVARELRDKHGHKVNIEKLLDDS